jgi:hypothetical protein
MDKRILLKKILVSFFMSLMMLSFSGLGSIKAEIITRPDVNVTLRAVFDADNIVPSSGIIGAYGSTLSMSDSLATLEDYSFAFWIVNGVVRKDLPFHYEFILTKDIVIEGIFSNSEEHAVVFMDTNGKVIDIQYVLHGMDAIDIVSGLPNKPNYLISSTKWDYSLQNITEDCVRILQYVINTTTTYTLDVVGGTGSGTYLFNDVATLVATPEPGQVFQYWQIDNEIVSYNTTYSLSLYANIHVEAIYGEEEVTKVPVVSISESLSLRSEKSSFVGQMYIPSGYTLIEYGMFTSPLACECISDGDNVSTQRQSNKFYGPTGEFLMTFTTLDIGHVMAYMIVKNLNGDLIFYQSEQQRVPDVLSNQPVSLGTAGEFVILTKTGVTTTGSTLITGNMGVSPAALSYFTGFALIIDISGEFATSDLVVGRVYAADLVAPTPAFLTQAISAMESAYTDAASRAPDCININDGDISGKNLGPGVYKWDMSVVVNTDITLTGSATDVWIFQIPTTLTVAPNVKIILSGGALPENVFWQTGTSVTLGNDVSFQGIVLAKTHIALGANSTVVGKLLSQTAVTLVSNKID